MRRFTALPRGDVALAELYRRGGAANGIGAFGVACLRLLLLLFLAWLLVGCAAEQGTRLRYAEVLHGPEQPRDVAWQIRIPSTHCMEQARYFVRQPSDLYSVSSLPPSLHERSAAVARSLHPTAKQVLRRIGGVWFARDIPGADARFIPCQAAGGQQGMILLDAAADFPNGVRDADVPHLYWQLLGGTTELEPSSLAVHLRANHGLRYVLLHELGHALSLLAGEFALGPDQQFDVGSWDGFLSYSWRPRQVYAFGSELHEGGGVVPTGLAFRDWRRVRRLLDGGATWLAPGYRSPTRHHGSELCSMVSKLPRAGFVTPTAAVAPTEDYAELFAHAILADEGKIHPDDIIEITLDGCPSQTLPAPYFAPGVSPKREYIERQLDL